jgi:hypothetical protein
MYVKNICSNPIFATIGYQQSCPPYFELSAFSSGSPTTVGAGSSFLESYEGIDSATFKQLFPEHFSNATFHELARRSGRITVPVLQDFAQQSTDVFLSHDWGTDELGRNNHGRVRTINRILKEKGLHTWFDKEELKGNVQEQIGICRPQGRDTPRLSSRSEVTRRKA